MVAPADTIAGAPAIGGASGACTAIDITTFTVEAGEQAALTFDNFIDGSSFSTYSRGVPLHQVLMAKSAWVAWTCPADGRYAFSLLGSSASWDSTLQVYLSGVPNTPAALAGRKVAENDEAIVNDVATNHLSYAPFDATAGAVYLVRICGNTVPAAGINTILSWLAVEAITNDHLAAPDVVSDAATISGDTTGAREMTVLEVGWTTLERAVWSRFVAARSGRYTFTAGVGTAVLIMIGDSGDPRVGNGARFIDPGETFTVGLPSGSACRIGLANTDAPPGPVSATVAFAPTAFATCDVSPDAAGTPMIPVVAPPADYAGDDATDLVDYPDPVLDAMGRPVP